MALLIGTALWGAPLFENGKTQWKIQIPEKPSKTEEYAAGELAHYLQLCSLCRFSIVKSDVLPKENTIVIGTPATSSAVKTQEKQLKLDTGSEQKFAVHTIGDNLYIAGKGYRGILPGVYTFLQDVMGIRWFWPGSEPNGEFVPRKQTFSLPGLSIGYESPIRYRGYHFLNGTNLDLEKWLARNFGNIIRHGRAGGPECIEQRAVLGFYNHNSGHNIDPEFFKVNTDEFFRTHPEWFAEVMGKRSRTQFCWNNPDAEDFMVAEFVKQIESTPKIDILGFYPTDDQNYCTCKLCIRKDVSTNWFEFVNRLKGRLSKKFPGLKFSSIAYQGYIEYPKCPMSGYEFIEYAPYGRCFTHKLTDPCPVNERALECWNKWLASGVPTGVYGYEFDVFTPIMLIPFYSWLGEQAKFFRKNNVISHMPEIHGTWGGKNPLYGYEHQRIEMRLAFYVCSRLMWKPDEDVNGLIRDFCSHVYPMGQEEMFEYHTLSDRFWSSQKGHLTGYFNSPITVVGEILSNERITEMFALLSNAEKKAEKNPDPVERAREKKEIEFEKKHLAKWVQFSWMNTENIVNVPSKKPLEFGMGSSLFSCVWSPKKLSLNVLKTDADKVEAELVQADGAKVFANAPVKDGKCLLEFKTSLEHGSCRQLLLKLFRDGKALESSGSETKFVMYMNKLPDTARKAVVSSPSTLPARDNAPKLRHSLMNAGWQSEVITDSGKTVSLDLETCDVFAVRMPGNPLPDSFYREKLLNYVRNGGLVILSADHDVDFVRLFGDRAFKLNWTGKQDFAWKLRKTQWLREGEWRTKPDNLEKALNTYCTPYYGYEIPLGSKWEEYARMRKKDGSTASYLMRMKIGKGELWLVSGPLGLDLDGQWMICGSSHHDSVTALFNNLFANRK